MGANIEDIDWAAVMIRTAQAVGRARSVNLSIVNGVAAELPAVFRFYQINTLRRQQHFISETAVESDYFHTLEEYASGDAYDTRTDLGFTAARDGDGRTNKGFGLIQTTGPYNQRKALAALKGRHGFDVTQDVRRAREVLLVPKYAAWAAGIYWGDNKLNAVCDRDNTGQLVGRAINRGNANAKQAANGERERKIMFTACGKLLSPPPLLKRGVAAVPLVVARPTEALPEVAVAVDGVAQPAGVVAVTKADVPMAEPVQNADGSWTQAPAAAPAPAHDPAQIEAAKPKETDEPPAPHEAPEQLEPWLTPSLVEQTQQRLIERNWFAAGTPDGDVGRRTVGAISEVQFTLGLPVTGKLDRETFAAIWRDDFQAAPISTTRALATVADLRGKAKQVDAAEGIKTASVWTGGAGLLVAGGSAVVSGFGSAMDAIKPIREAFADVPGWGWGTMVAVAIGVPAAYSWYKAHRVERETLHDYQSGKRATAT